MKKIAIIVSLIFSILISEISIGESEFVRVKIAGKNNIDYFMRLFVIKKDLHAKFIEFLDTSDYYILPKLRIVLRECFKE